jgi:hypothetical protein
VPQPAQNRASGALIAEHDWHVFSTLAPQLLQYLPGCALSPQ